MENASDSKNVALSLDTDDHLPGRARSGSAGSGHRRSTSGSLLSKLSFLRMNQATQNIPERNHSGIQRDDGDDFGSNLRGGRAMASALQHKRTRRRRGSLRKTALLGTRFDHRDKKVNRATVDFLRGDVNGQQTQTSNTQMRSLADPVSPENEYSLRVDSNQGNNENNPRWGLMDTQQRSLDTSSLNQRKHLSKENMLSDEMGTDDEELVSFPRVKNSNTAVAAAFHNSSASSTSGAAGLHMPTPSSSSDSYFALQAGSTYRAVHRTTSPLATHAAEMKNSQEIAWDYSETEWWGWIILIVTWLVFVVGMGSCFGVWSWAWDVGETPYAPPELEDDPTLPIVGYYPALITLTAVMSWVWVVVAWVGMKYFKHANIPDI